MRADLEVRKAVPADAASLLAMYEEALGVGGVGGFGCDPYPDPQCFTAAGSAELVSGGARTPIVALLDGEIVGAEIIEWSSPFHAELVSFAVPQRRRGQGIGRALVQHIRNLYERRSLVIDQTELVTHSLASQALHVEAGFDRIVGYAHRRYGAVFVPGVPESVVATCTFWGRVTSSSIRSDADEALAMQLEMTRHIYVPARFRVLVDEIAAQFLPAFRWRMDNADGTECPGAPENGRWSLTRRGDVGWMTQRSDSLDGEDDVEAATAQALGWGCRHVQARVPVNQPAAAGVIAYLCTQGFIFQSFLPCGQWSEARQSFSDIVQLQWISHEHRHEQWPGETGSRVHVFGYPRGTVGAVINAIRREGEAQIRPDHRQ